MSSLCPLRRSGVRELNAIRFCHQRNSVLIAVDKGVVQHDHQRQEIRLYSSCQAKRNEMRGSTMGKGALKLVPADLVCF